MFQRPGKIADYFPPPFPNDQAARAALGGELPPDMSVLAKARSYEAGFPWFIFDAFTEYQEDGPDYIHAILNGYTSRRPGSRWRRAPITTSTSPATPSACRKPLNDGQVEYTDGTPTTVDQYGRDVAAFLMWAAEPTLDERKRLGFQVMIFLIVFTGLLYFTKKRVWHAVDPHAPAELTARRPNIGAARRRRLRTTSCRIMTKPWSPRRAATSAVASISRKPTTIAAGMAASAALMKNSTRRKKGMRRSTMTKRWAIDHDRVLRLRRPPWFARVRPAASPRSAR